ncbi:molybdopterin-synthase adenylyltransferase MoeB [Spirosoma sp.]|uniref:molybdopterin-synthase adenylyltransferase MoeB n=1 Tax=Spirosoma sp. TaxID=1899569 RepID=UPI0026377014|nr:molybdopterin-synthase adenylyltransferase MoeB [Spirosoma sp.]MCX6218821.1 molybdopterin-synthase adenylyltransferase MoeB [Spirosoma sp.]
MTSGELNRYSRHISLPEIGLAGQQRLKQARVVLVGAGGLGCPVGQYLTAAGVGTLGIIDGDVVEESNLQRQILFSPEHVGQPKATVAATLLARQNPYSQVVAHPVFLTRDNALSILSDYDIVVDGSDNFATRYLVNDACVLLGKPLVFGSIYKFDGQVSVFNHENGPTYRCLYPEPSELAACAEVGVLGVLPGLTGCLMASEVIKLVTGVGDLLSGTLLVFNALTLSFNTFSFTADPVNKSITALTPSETDCALPVPEITVSDWLAQTNRSFLVDVREPHEYERENMGGQLLPLAELYKHPERVPSDRPVVIHCQSGARSRKAVAFLRAQGYQNVLSLQGGLNALKRL